MAAKITNAEAKRRRARLVEAWNSLAVPATISAGARHVGCHHHVVSRWIKQNRDGVGDAFERAQGGYRHDGKAPEVPDFVTFRSQCFGHSSPPFQAEMIAAIESNDQTLILLPPSHGKTSLMIEYMVWRIVKDRNVRIIYVSKTQAFAKKGLHLLKRYLADASWYEANQLRNVVTEWGPFKPTADEKGTPWTSELVYVSGISSQDKDPTCQALGVGNQVYGARADLIICDDIATLDNMLSEVTRDNMIAWLVQELQTRLDPDGKMVMIGTRVRETDLYSTLISEDTDWAVDWAKVIKPAIISDESKLALWSEHRPYEYIVRRHRNRMPARLFSLIYQQTATGAPDNPFQLSALNDAKEEGLRVGERIPHLSTVVMGVDPALAGTLAIVVLAFDRETKERFVLDCVTLTNFQQPDVGKRLIVDTAARFGVVRARIEKNAMQGWLTKDTQFRRQLLGVGCQLEEEYTHKGNKYDPDWGVGAVAGLFDEGLYHIPWSPDSRVRMQPFIDELAAWRPGVKVKQDRVMALWLADLQLRKLGILKPGMPTHNPGVPAWVRNRKVPGWVRQDDARRHPKTRFVDQDGVHKDTYEGSELIGGRRKPFHRG